MVFLSKASDVQQSYDFIIVGGGTAGCVLANRLSSRTDFTVLLVEAGEYLPNDEKINTPGRMVELTGNPDYDWCFHTTPQEHCNNRSISYSCGRVLGGSSALQYGMCVFPSTRSIDGWAELGNPGWDWDSLAPYYRKFHTLQMPSDRVIDQLDLAWIDKNTPLPTGPLKVSFPGPDFITPLHKAWPRTFKTLGFRPTTDPMLGKTIGGYCNPATVDADSKTRSYAAPAYIAPVADRLNLHVLTDAKVEQLRFREDYNNNHVADGIRWSSNGRSCVTGARKEVLICSGALQSSQLLEISGIGDSQRLQSLGIKCFVDNPNVGENLQDHAYVRVAFELKDDVPTGPGLDELIRQYHSSKTGPLTSTVICNAYMPLPEYMPEQKLMDRAALENAINLHTGLAANASHPSRREQYECIRRILADEGDTTIQYRLAPFRANAHMGPAPRNVVRTDEVTNYVAISSTLSHPFSRGSIHITSAQPHTKAAFDPKYLSNPIDLEVLARQVAFTETIAETPPLANLIKEGGRRIPDRPTNKSLDEVKQMVRESCVSTYHASSTCSMLPRQLGGVVDTALKVYGTSNVRVCDASIFPLVPRGNIQSSVYAVAEKVSDIILSEYPSRSSRL